MFSAVLAAVKSGVAVLLRFGRKGSLKPGERAPEFTLPDATGAHVRLSELLRRGPVLTVFMPNAFTPVCSAELDALPGLTQRAQAAGATVAVISCDSRHVLAAWQRQTISGRTAVHLLSDFWPHGAVCRSYGAFNPSTGGATRISYVIAQSGVVSAVEQAAPGQARSNEQLLQVLDTLHNQENLRG